MIAAPLVRERPPLAARRIVARRGPGWPEGLDALADAPACLHLEGLDPPRAAHAVAIVGSRAATPYGLQFAARLAADLTAAGYVVVSGLARGIDAAAHEGALTGGTTVAVLPGGLDSITPPEHAGLAARIAARGTLLSEVERGGPFGPGAFVKRNRIIAALAAVTVVVEASERSGALTTARFAERLGRPCLAVPGDLDRPTSRGPIALLRRGALLCTGASDVRAALESAGHAPPASGTRARIAAALGADPVPLEALAAAASLPPAEVLAHLAELEWAGLAAAHPGGRWARRR